MTNTLSLNENFLIVENMMLNAENQLYRLQEETDYDSDNFLDEEYSYLLDEEEEKPSKSSKVKEVINNILTAIKKFFTTIWNAIKSFFIWLGKLIKNLFNKIRGRKDKIESVSLKSIFQAKQASTALKAALGKELTAENYNEMKNKLSEFEGLVKNLREEKATQEVQIDQLTKALADTQKQNEENEKWSAAQIEALGKQLELFKKQTLDKTAELDSLKIENNKLKAEHARLLMKYEQVANELDKIIAAATKKIYNRIDKDQGNMINADKDQLQKLGFSKDRVDSIAKNAASQYMADQPIEN